MSGYIGNVPVPAATQTRDTFTATAGQTTFATSGYTPSFLDVFLNGVHLVNGTDYTASNGSDVVLTSGAAAGDTLEVVAYSTYQVNSQNYTGGLTVDNDGATVLTVDRATSDGTIIDLQKDGSSVGAVGANAGFITIGKGDTGLLFHDGNDAIWPRNLTTLSGRDGAIDLGGSGDRFRNLYLSGGVYLGGTGAANYLDDYEEGTWTPTLTFGGASTGITYNIRVGRYTKIGRIVTAQFLIRLTSKGTDSGSAVITGLPFPHYAGSQENASTLIFEAGGSGVNLPNAYAMAWNDSKAYLRYQGSAGYLPFDNSHFTNSTHIFTILVYETA